MTNSLLFSQILIYKVIFGNVFYQTFESFHQLFQFLPVRTYAKYKEGKTLRGII